MAGKSIFKLTMAFLLLSGLFYSSTRVASYNPAELSSEFPAYPPPSTPGYPQTGNEIALPLIMNFSHSAPHYTTSLYFDRVDPGVMFAQGCNLANQVVEMDGEQDSAVIINFCQPWETGGTEGVWLCDDGGFARISDSPIEDSVEEAARSYAEAFYLCSYGYPDTLVMVIGTNNFGNYYVDTQSGTEWANMVNRVNSWLINMRYFYRVQAVGGSDMEIAYNSFETTLEWVEGYESTNNYLLYDFGDAQGCPFERSNYNGYCDNQWHQSDVWDISHNGSREAFPLIYNEWGTNAMQWYSLSAYSFIFHYELMPITGSVTQHQACLDGRSGCTGTDNEPHEGYNQLWYWLNQDPDTAHTPRWSTDFRHYWDISQ